MAHGGFHDAHPDGPPVVPAVAAYVDLLRTASAVCPHRALSPAQRGSARSVPGVRRGFCARPHHPRRGDDPCLHPVRSPVRTRLSTRHAPRRRVLLAGGAAGRGARPGWPRASTADAAAGGSDRLALVAYSTPKEAYAELIPAFQRTAAGSGVTFAQSYGASGAQSRAVVAGLPADVAALSLAPDVTKLVDAGLVAKDWDADAYHGIVTRSVVVLVVRKGNPKHIQGWDDLVSTGREGADARTR